MERIILSKLVVILGLAVGYTSAYAQYLRNPSLEGNIGDELPPAFWNTDHDWSDPDLLDVYYTMESSAEYWPVDGNIFLLFRARGTTYNETWHAPLQREYLYQQLAKPLESNSCYRFDAYLAFNPDYRVNDTQDPNVGYPLKFMLYGGNEPQSREKLLIESDPVANTSWIQYTFYFSTEDTSYSYLLMETMWDTINVKSSPYNGMILIDNLRLENLGSLDTINEHTVYFQGDGETQLFAANGLSYSWSPDGFLYPPDGQLPYMLTYHDQFNVYIDREEQCVSMEIFNVILDCDTLYKGSDERQKEYYYKYDTLVKLEATSGKSWIWDPPVNLTAYDIRAPRMTGFQDHYTVTITDNYGCIFTDIFNILLHCDTLYPESTILVLDTLIEQESSLVLIPKYGIIDGLWTPVRFLDCYDCQTPVTSPRNTIQYHVELTDEFGCKHAEEFFVEVNFRVPNVITPNGDGYNDCLKIFGLPENTAFRVYDKDGLLLYTTDTYDYNFCWEGVDQQGDPLKAGNYWYALDHPLHGILKKDFILIVR